MLEEDAGVPPLPVTGPWRMPMTGDSGLPTFGPAGRRPAQPERIKPDAAEADVARLRISDQERQEFVDQLTRHCAEGRITFDELDERVAKAWEARTQADLAPLAADLPDLPAAKGREADFKTWLEDGKAMFMTMPSRAVIAGAAGLLLVFLLLAALAPFGHTR
jgi:uncharacterized protein DUF1707